MSPAPLAPSDRGAVTVTGTAVPVRRSIRVSRFLKDLALTTVTSLATIAALVLVTKVLAARLGPEGFGAYMLARRIVATLDPVSTFSMAIALTRFAALAGDDDQRRRVLVSGVLLAMGAASVFGLAAVAAPVPLARLLFADASYAPLVIATGAMVIAYSAFILLYAWYRGLDRMTLANIWQLAAIAVGPLLAAWFVAAPGGEARVVFAFAAILAAATLPLAAWVAWALRGPRPLDRDVMRSMIRYAGPRVPGGFAFAGLLAIGPVIAPHVASLVAVGYVAAGQALLKVVEGATEAFGRVALPKIAQLSAAREDGILRERIADVAAVVVHVGLYATLHLWLWAPALVAVWLGEEYGGAVGAVRLIVLGVLPYLLFVTLRSVLDAMEERAVNAVNLYIAMAVTAAAALLIGRRFEAEGLAAATSLGLTVLGVLTVRALRHRCPFPVPPLLLSRVIAVNVALVAVAAIARMLGERAGAGPLVIVAGTETILLMVYAALLWYFDARWILELRRRIEVTNA